MKKNEIIAPKVEKREYFCIVKRLVDIFKTIIIGVILLTLNGITPASAQSVTNQTDSIEVSLLTCSPRNEIYSLYGHTALRYRNLHTGEDWAFNYGIFSFKKPFFILRFTLGKTDYELGVIPFDIFKREYRNAGCQVVEQVLNISDTEKMYIYNALKENFRPENRVYRYNFFYNNCTTKARDIIENSIEGKIIYKETPKESALSFREVIHQYAKGHPWAACGNDLCLGVKADFKMNTREQQFIPGNLMHDFDQAEIYFNGQYKPLVKARNIVVEPKIQIVEQEFPLSPKQCAWLIFAISLAIVAIEYKKGYTYKAWDIVLMFVQGIAGIIVLALFFSEHPTTSTNLQVLLLNPIPLFFIPQVIKGKKKTYWKLSTAMIIMFFIGAFFQDYAEGMEIMALSLLTRCWIHLKRNLYKNSK